MLAFLVGISAVAGLSDEAGLFELLAHRTARLSHGSTRRLLLLVCALATVVTVTLSLDTTAVLLTPVVLALAAAVDVDARPFAYAVVWLANGASLLLPVSNLTNLLAADRLGPLGVLGFTRRMVLPELVAVAIVVALLLVIFRESLRVRHSHPIRYVPADRPLVVLAALCCLAVAPASLIGVAPWKVATPAAVVLFGGSPSAEGICSRPLLLGTNAGPMLLLSGSLATLLWRDRCRARGLEIGWRQFLRLGLLVVPPLLLGTYGALLVTS